MGQRHSLRPVRPRSRHGPLRNGSLCCISTPIWALPFTTGERTFPWRRSYAWSREGTRYNCVTSGLMALEAWAHRRIEAGESFGEVLRDVLGPPEAPAAATAGQAGKKIAAVAGSNRSLAASHASSTVFAFERYSDHDSYFESGYVSPASYACFNASSRVVPCFSMRQSR